MPVGAADLSRIRVATNSHSPLVTRVVLDLTERVPYTVQGQGDSELVIDLGDSPARVTATSAAPTAATPKPAEPALERAAVTPESPIVPDRDPGPPATDAAPATMIATGSSGAAAAAPAPAALPRPASGTAA